MALWMVRAGRHGEYENKFLDDNRVYLTWYKLDRDLSSLETKVRLRTYLESRFPDAPKGKIRNHLGQVWTFVKVMSPGDWVVLPSKMKPAIHVAEIKGPYHYDPVADPPLQPLPRCEMDRPGCSPVKFRPGRSLFLWGGNDRLPNQEKRGGKAGQGNGKEGLDRTTGSASHKADRPG